jgi:hypothetical protein
VHRQIPLYIVLVSGIVFVIQFFIPSHESEFLFEYGQDWVMVIGILALPLGIWSYLRKTWLTAVRKPKERFFAGVSLFGFAIMMVTGLRRESLMAGSLYMELFEYVLIPIQATIFSLLAFYIASAAYRAFRARSVIATLLLGTAFIVMLRLIPLGPISDVNQAVVGWILSVPNMAAKRGLLIGIGLGAIATCIKIILGIERTYMGRD